MTIRTMIFIAACTSGISATAHAQEAFQVETITLAAAATAAQVAINTCKDNGHTVSVTVVGSDGRIKVQMVSDGSFIHGATASYRKAFTAVSRQVPTAAIEAATKDDPALATIFNNLPDMITWGGGKPIMKGETIIGGIGLSGAPGGDEDIKCVDAGLAAIAG